MGLSFVISSILLGIGLAMDAFSVSLANGLQEPHMRYQKRCGIAGIFATFQFLMPLIGWFCVHSIAKLFSVFQDFIPWIAFGLLLFIGGNMIKEAFSESEEEVHIGKGTLLAQGVATSIDALSVGFTIANYDVTHALLSSLLIGLVTFVICYVGILLGRKAGTKLSSKANIFGGIILIAIGLEILLKGIF